MCIYHFLINYQILNPLDTYKYVKTTYFTNHPQRNAKGAMDKVTEKGHSCQHQHHRKKNKFKVEHHVEYDNLLTPRCIIEEGSMVFFRFFFKIIAQIFLLKKFAHIFTQKLSFSFTQQMFAIFFGKYFLGRNRHLFFHRKK